MGDICVKYAKYIKNKIRDLDYIIIFYGSNIYNLSSSDLDICIILENIDDVRINDFIKYTIEFQKENNLKIDEEIPFTNKLIYTWNEIQEMFLFSPFVQNGKYIINDIEKTKKFLSSREMKYRLLLNILTTDHKVLFDEKNLVKGYELRAWDIILDAIINYFKIEDVSEENILTHLYENQITQANGENYLGYKKGKKEKEEYLKQQVVSNLKRRGDICD